jgi:chemotaxis protein CheX
MSEAKMNVKFINPFVEAASEVIQMETGVELRHGELRLEKTAYQTDDITVILALVGMVSGIVLYSLSSETAVALASRMLGEKLESFNNLAQSGIAELGNVITGKAGVKLSGSGFEATISPPTLVVGKGMTISTLDRPRLVVPFESENGSITIHLALREASTNFVSAAHMPVPSRPDLK